MNFNKKSMVMKYVIEIVVIILSFFILLSFFSNVTTELATKSQDMECRVFVSMKDTTYLKVAEQFLGTLNQKCKKDEVTHLFESKSKTYSEVSNLMNRCWNRYGSGKYDFLNNVNTQGDWCFVCAKLDFKSGGEVYDYQDFISYLKQEKKMVKLDDGSEVQKSLYEILNVQYADINNLDDFYNMRGEINSMLDENDPSINRIVAQLQNEYEYIQDLRLKKIDTTEPLYIVYRYDKPDNSFLDSKTQALVGGIGGLIGGVAVSTAVSLGVETATYSLISGAACGSVSFGILAIPCGVGGAVFGAVKGILKKVKSGTETILKLKRITKIAEKLKSFRKVSKVVEEVEDIEKIVDVVDIKKVDEILELASKVRKVDVDLASDYEKLHNNLKKLNIDNIDDIEDVVKNLDTDVASTREYLRNLHKTSGEILSNPDITKAISDTTKELDAQVEELNNAKESLDEVNKMRDYIKEMNEIKDADFDELIASDEGKAKLSKLIKYSFIASSTVVGSGVAEKLNFYEYQYVDVMTQEQYYRLCGTERFNEVSS